MSRNAVCEKRSGRGRRSGVWTALLAAALLASPGAALGQTTDQSAAAEAAFREGNRLMAEGKPEEACPKFAASHRLDPSFGAVYNLGNCYEDIGKTASAWAAFREAGEIAARRKESERADKAKKRAAALDPKLVKLRVVAESPPPGLVIERDDVTLDPGLWDIELPVDPGSHKITAKAPGKAPWTSTVTLTEQGKTSVVRVPPLADSAAPASVAGTPPRAATADSRAAGAPGMPVQRVVAAGALGLGVSGLAVGTAFGVLALSKWGEAKNGHCDASNACDDRGISLQQDARTMAHVSTAGFVVGGVSVVTAAVLWLTAPSPGGKTGYLPNVAPVVGAGSGGVVLTGSF
jgi:hypothetical protein